MVSGVDVKDRFGCVFEEDVQGGLYEVINDIFVSVDLGDTPGKAMSIKIAPHMMRRGMGD